MNKINCKMVYKDIKKLDLSKNKITHLSKYIGKLTQLTELNISFNNLTQLTSRNRKTHTIN